MQEEVFVNKVANSGLITIDLETYYPKDAFVHFDMKDHLFMGLILKEKDFREALKNIDWTIYQNKNVCIVCTADAIIPIWAFMLVAAYVKPFAKTIYNTTAENAITQNIIDAIYKIDTNEYTDQRIVIKGCGEKQIGEAVYIAITALLQPVAKSIMYGEPCSTVPIYKKK
jgi:hypothetical protein